MSDATLVLTEPVAAALAAIAADDRESAAVLIVGVHRGGGRLRLLARELHPVADADCDRQADEITVLSAGWVRAVTRAAELGAAAVWVHTHPGGDPSPSRRDAVVDRQLQGPFAVRTGSSVYGSVVVSPSDGPGDFAFTGTGLDGDDPFTITTTFVVGGRFRLLHAHGNESPAASDGLYDRQVRAFGGGVQSVLGSLSVGLAGAGGTGSAVAEQLARLGVTDLAVFDPDVLSASNTTRVYGSAPGQVGQSKVQVLSDHLARIAPQCRVAAVAGKITQERNARLLAGCDVVFGCTDDEAGRMVLSRLTSYQLVPVIDCGVLIDSAGGTVRGIHARVTVLHPGAACLLCRGRVDTARAAAELAAPDEHARLAAEGYAPELPGVEPAVVAYTTLAAALAVGELLERLVGYGQDPAPSEVLARVHEREIGTNTRQPRAGHYCHPDAAQLGTGDTVPFLGQAWAA